MHDTVPHIIEEITHEVPFELLLVFSFILLCSLAARRLRQPAVTGCFVGGFLLHVLTTLTGFDLAPHLHLNAQAIFVLIALLIFNEGLNVEIESLKKNGVEIAVLAILGTFLGAALCGGLLKTLFGWPWVVAIIVGAMLVPTDAGAVLAVLSRLGVPERWRSLIAGESIFNDPFGLILFGLAVGVWTGQDPGWAETILKVVGGSALLGMTLGYLFYRLYRTMSDPVSELILSGMLFTAAFFGAEHFHMSGFLAVAASSIFVGNRKALCMDPETVETVDRVWEAAAIGVEGFLFIMIGAAIPLEDLWRHFGLGMAAIAAVTVARSCVVHPLLWVLDRFFRQDVPWRWRVVVDLGGLHVGVTMAILLSLPKDLPGIEQIRVMGYYVIIWSVLVLPVLVRAAVRMLGLKTQGPAEEEG